MKALEQLYKTDRNLIGFEKLFDAIDSSMINAKNTYPPYNILVLEDGYRIELAVAGFDESEISLEFLDGILTIKGIKKDGERKEYLHKGIAFRDFERKFTIADSVEILDASLDQGLLVINLANNEKIKKPIQIKLNGTKPTEEKTLLVE